MLHRKAVQGAEAAAQMAPFAVAAGFARQEEVAEFLEILSRQRPQRLRAGGGTERRGEGAVIALDALRLQPLDVEKMEVPVPKQAQAIHAGIAEAAQAGR